MCFWLIHQCDSIWKRIRCWNRHLAQCTPNQMIKHWSFFKQTDGPRVLSSKMNNIYKILFFPVPGIVYIFTSLANDNKPKVYIENDLSTQMVPQFKYVHYTHIRPVDRLKKNVPSNKMHFVFHWQIKAEL